MSLARERGTVPAVTRAWPHDPQNRAVGWFSPPHRSHRMLPTAIEACPGARGAPSHPGGGVEGGAMGTWAPLPNAAGEDVVGTSVKGASVAPLSGSEEPAAAAG